MAQAISNLPIGARVKIPVNGVDTVFIVVQQGAPDASYSTKQYSNCNGAWLMAETLYGTARQWHSSYANVKFTASAIKTYLNSTFYSLLDATVQASILSAKLPITYGYTSITGSSSSATPVFLLSLGEVMLDYGSGYTLEYFRGQNDNLENDYDHPLLVAKDTNGTARIWWLRDAQAIDWDDGEDSGTDLCAYAVYTSGRYWAPYVNDSNYVRPCFILNSAFEVSDVCDDDVCYTIGGGGSGSSKFYTGDTSAKAQAVKKLYVGDANGVAQKVKKLYAGDANGIARLVYSAHEPNTLSYQGTVTALSATRWGHAGASNPKYALFAGGYNNISSVDAYSASLVRSTAPALSQGRQDIGAASIGDYAIFAGGNRTNSTPSSYVDAYNSSLTKTQKYLSLSRGYVRGASVGSYAIFSAGYYDDDEEYGPVDNTDAFNKSLTRSTLSGGYARYEHGGVSNGNYAIFGGGRDNSYVYSNVWYWNASLTRSTTSLFVSSGNPAGVRAGDYALFVAGDDADNLSPSYNDNIVNIFDSSMTRSITFLRRTGYDSFDGTASLGKYGIVWGGYQVDGWLHVFDDKLTYLSKDMSGISKVQMNAAATIGDYALFSGGAGYENGSTTHAYRSTVHAFKLI